MGELTLAEKIAQGVELSDAEREQAALILAANAPPPPSHREVERGTAGFTDDDAEVHNGIDPDEVKGPDPKHWGEDEARVADAAKLTDALAVTVTEG